ncbi:hypothetical protein M5689_024574 [Euphorbia peplus]|nr:hypothetical protein M5689_024574 [Euphorbia peplus]
MAGSAPSDRLPTGSRRIDEMFAAFNQHNKTPEKPKSYATAVTQPSQIPPISDVVIYDDGEFKSVKINRTAFEKRIQLCHHSLIGHLNLNKGDTPWKLDELRSALLKEWGISIPWRLISLGKGFYHLLLPSNDIKQLVRSRGVLGLTPGVFRVQPWSPDFDPFSQKTSSTQIWVRLYNLPWVYWDPIILSDISRCLGGLIKIDRATLEGDYGHFARILLDIDMASKLYEDLPKFCKQCSSLRHVAYQCKQVSEDGTTKQTNSAVISITSKFSRSSELKRSLDKGPQTQVEGGRTRHPVHNSSNPPKEPDIIRVWKQVQTRSEDFVPVTRVHNRINTALNKHQPHGVKDLVSGEFVVVEDIKSSSSSEEDNEAENALPLVNWQPQRVHHNPVCIVFPELPPQVSVLSPNKFDILSELEKNADTNF